jgi:hypothetical protein
MKKFFFLSLLFLFGGCAPTPVPGSNPTDMTAEEHRKEALQHEAEVREHEDHAQAAFARERGSGSSIHRPEVFTHENHVTAHRQAAQALEKLSSAACAEIPADHRSYCPLDDPKVSKKVVSTPQGIQIVMNSAPIGGIKDVEAHVKCHLAFGHVHEAKNAGCPLYLKGVQTTVGGTDQNTVISFQASDPKDVMLLQAWGKLVLGEQTK